MTQVDQLVARSGELKGEVLAFAQGKRFAGVMGEALAEWFDSKEIEDQYEMIGFLEHFLLQRRFSDGRTMVERFVRARGDLPRIERDMLLGWVNVIEDIFEVERLDGKAMIAINLLDELPYRVHSNMGPATFDVMPPGTFVVARIVPVLDEWLISGALSTLGTDAAESLLPILSERALQHPEFVFRNPRLLERGWELQRDDRAAFIEFFGTDLVVLTGAEAVAQMKEFRRGRTDDSAVLEWPLPEQADEESVGLIYDEHEGLGLFNDFRRFQQVFEDPQLIAQPDHADIIVIYMTDDTVSPAPFRRCAESWPDGADQVFAQFLGEPNFSWARDGEALLRSAKPGYFEPRFPRFVPVGSRLTERLRAVYVEPQTISAT